MIASQIVEAVPVYAPDADYYAEPVGQDLQKGVIPLDTLPAGWWNYLWHNITKNEARTVTVLDSITSEILNVLADGGITADGNQVVQLRNAIREMIKGSVGILANLTTTEQDNLVDAINELNTNMGKLEDISSSLSKTSFVSALNSFFEKGGQINGYATLDSTGRIPASQLPESALEFKGFWNAATNTPVLENGVGTNGDMYIVSVGGQWNGIQFNTGDRIIYDGSTEEWGRLSGGEVLSVNNKIGNVVLYASDILMEEGGQTISEALDEKVDASTTVNGHALTDDVEVTAEDVGLGNVDNTSDEDKPVSTAMQNALDEKQDELVSGTTIKTVNGQSILGPGNINVADDYAPHFTYIVDSDEKLENWLAFKTSDIFTSVLIKRGTWTYLGETAPLDTIGTLEIVGEPGAEIIISEMGYSQPGYKMERSMRNVRVKGVLKNMSNVRNVGYPINPVVLTHMSSSPRTIGYSRDGFTVSPTDKATNTLNRIGGRGFFFIDDINSKTDSTSRYKYSEDGITWEPGSVSGSSLDYLTPGSTALTPPVYAPDKGILVGGLSAGAVLPDGPFWSTDGKNWTKGNVPNPQAAFSGGENQLVYGKGVFTTGQIWSEDGKTWSACTAPETMSRVYFIKEKDIFIGFVGGTHTNIYWSDDGKTWTAGTGPSTKPGIYLAHDPITGIITTGVYWSNDGKTWTACTGLSGVPRGYPISRGKGLFTCSAGSSPYSPYWSVDGKTWAAGSGYSGGGGGIYVNGLFINGRSWSADGKTWEDSGSSVANLSYIHGIFTNGSVSSSGGKGWIATKWTGTGSKPTSEPCRQQACCIIRDSFAVQNCSAEFINSYATSVASSFSECALEPAIGHNDTTLIV